MADTIYGPYTRKDGRKHIIKYNGVNRITQSYPRYLMEQKLGRELTVEETVDHINGDFTDDRLENLQVLSRENNIRKSSKKAEWLSFICSVCGNDFEMLARDYRGNQLVKQKAGPYCSKQCSGKVHN